MKKAIIFLIMFSILIASASAVNLSRYDLYAYFDFEETVSPLVDERGNAGNLELTGSPTRSTDNDFCANNACWYFDGDGEAAVNLTWFDPNIALDMYNLSICYWTYKTQDSSFEYLLRWVGATGKQISLTDAGSTNVWDWQFGSTESTLDIGWALNEKYMHCMTRNATGAGLYIYNNTGYAFYNQTITYGDNASGNIKFGIGGDPDQGANTRSYSYIDELMIWNKSLNKEEIEFLWNNGEGNFYHDLFQSLEFYIRDRETEELVNQTVNIALSSGDNFSTSNGTLIAKTIELQAGLYTAYLDSEGYATESLEFEVEDVVGIVEINAYLFNQSIDNSGKIIVETYDEFYNLLSGVNVKLLEYKADDNSFITVSQCYSDSNGECIFDVELNTKFYIIEATTTINDNLVTQRSTQTGQLIKIDNTVIEIHLQEGDIYQVDDLFGFQINVLNTELLNNVSNITVEFTDYNNINHTVCLNHYERRQTTDVLLNSDCVTSSSGTVNYASGYLLDRTITNVAKVEVTTNNQTLLFDEYIYLGVTGTIFGAYGYILKPILLFLLIASLGLSLWLKNIQIFAYISGFLSLFIPTIYAGILGGITVVFIIVIDACLIYMARRKR